MCTIASISPSNHIPLPGTPLFQLLKQGIGSHIRVNTVGGEIKGTLLDVLTGVISVRDESDLVQHIVFGTVISFSFDS
ncbi:hypothetical protein [Brevibacillus sp. 179-C9.3 HS]|uniref:hypothetical protein n=1 Tax=unclassified Brevibacillus TaxID=2684853 RepID=UPI00399FC9EB